MPWGPLRPESQWNHRGITRRQALRAANPSLARTPMLRFVLAAFSLSCPAWAQSTWYVDATGTPPGSGSQADPFTSVTFALAQSSVLAGDTILVEPGVYLDERVDFLGKDVLVQSTGGSAITALVGPGQQSPPNAPVVRFANGEGRGHGLRASRSGGALESRFSVDVWVEGSTS